MKNPIEPFFPLIGQVVVEFQTIETIVDFILMALLSKEDPNVVHSFATALQFGRKLDVVKAIAPFKIPRPDLNERLGSVIATLSNAEQERNRIIHSRYGWFGKDKVSVHKMGVSRKDGITGSGFRVVETSFVQDALDKDMTPIFRPTYDATLC